MASKVMAQPPSPLGEAVEQERRDAAQRPAARRSKPGSQDVEQRPEHQAENHRHVTGALACRAPQRGQEVDRRRQEQRGRNGRRQALRDQEDGRHDRHVADHQRAAEPGIVAGPHVERHAAQMLHRQHPGGDGDEMRQRIEHACARGRAAHLGHQRHHHRHQPDRRQRHGKGRRGKRVAGQDGADQDDIAPAAPRRRRS